MILYRIAVILSVLFLLSVFPLSADNTQPYDGYCRAEDFGSDGFLASLPEEVRRQLPSGDIFDSDTVGDKFGIEYFQNLLFGIVKTALKPTVGTFSVLLGILLLSAAMKSVREVCKNDSLTRLFDYTANLCIMLSMFRLLTEIFESVQSYLVTLTGIVTALLPVLTAVSVMGGNTNAATVSSGGILLAITLIETAASQGLYPILQICFGMTAATGIGGIRLSGITRRIREIFLWCLGFLAAAISALMTFQTSIAAKADSVAMRALKFAAAGAIPLGNIASDAVRTVAGSLSLVKSTVGFVGVAIIAVLTLPALVNVLLTKCAVGFAKTAAEILNLPSETALLYEYEGLLGFLSVVCLIAAVMTVYALTVFSSGSVALA